jgi:hypothetical protein
LSLHATTCAAERNWSLWGNVYSKARSWSLSRANQPKQTSSDMEVMLTVLEGDE